MKCLNHQKIIIMNSIFKTVILALCTATTLSVFAYTDFTKTIEESYDISYGGKVEIINKYGNIDMRVSEGNRVSFKIEITVEAKNQDRADEVFDLIDIDFYNNADYIKAETSVSDNNNFWKKLKNWDSSNYEINYYVNVPKHTYLILNNKYGHIYAEDMDNDMDINLKYGNFTIGNVHDLDVVLGYGNGKAAQVNAVDVDIKYGKLEIEKCDDILIESKYSHMSFEDVKDITSASKYDHYKVGSVQSIKNEGKYDNFKLGEVKSIIINSKYSDVDIEKLYSSGDFELGYGSIRIDELSSGFDEVNIVSRYTRIRIESESDAAFDYDIETEYADLDVPSYAEYEEDNNEKWVKASKNGGGKGKIKIKSKYGSVKIK